MLHLPRQFSLLVLVVMLPSGMNPQTTTKKPISELQDLITKAQTENVPGAKGKWEGMCFTADNYAEFQRKHRAKQIADEIVNTRTFREAVRALRDMQGPERVAALDEIQAMRQQTVAECGGRWDGTCQTEAGAKAQTDIAMEVRSALNKKLAGSSKTAR